MNKAKNVKSPQKDKLKQLWLEEAQYLNLWDSIGNESSKQNIQIQKVKAS